MTASTTDRLGSDSLGWVVAVLATTVITSYGVLYYTFAALSSSIAADTGWSSVAVTGAFSLAQMIAAAAGLGVGRHIDRLGPRRVMTLGSALAVPGLCTVAVAPSLLVFYVGWAVTGLAMAGVLYPPAFAALTHWGGHRRVGALTTLTLVAGLASTVFAPLASWFDGWWGWRLTYLALVGLLAAVTIPLHWWGLDHPWRQPTTDPGRGSSEGAPPTRLAGARAVIRSRPFVLLSVAFALSSLAIYAAIVNQVPLLVERGMGPGFAAVMLGLTGVGQVLGRLGYARLVTRSSVTFRTVSVTLGVGITTALLAVAPASVGVLLVVAVLVGLARGIETLVQATAVTDRWGPLAYGTLNGVLTAPALVAAAVAPFVGAALAQVTGSYEGAFLVLAVLAALAGALVVGAAPARSAVKARATT